MGANDSDSNAFDRFASIWRRRRGLIIATFAIVVVPSVCAVFALPNVYEAQATVIPVGDALAGQGGGLSDSTDSLVLDSVTEQVLSRDRLAALIRRFDLTPNAAPGTAPATAAMRKDISVAPQNVSRDGSDHPYALNISYRGGDPQKVAAVTNSLAASYETVARSMQDRAYASAAVTLKGRLALLRKKLDNQQSLIDRYRNEHRGQLPDQQDANLAAMQRLDSRLRDNDAKQLRLMESRANLVQKLGDSGQSALPQLEQRLANLKLQYTDEYPEVQELTQRIARLKANQGREGKAEGSSTPFEKTLAQVDSELVSLQREETRLRARISKYQQYLDNAPMAAQRLKALTQGYSEASDLYASLLKRYEQVRIAHGASSGDGPAFKVLESAMVPIAPSGPGRLRLLAICLVLGIGFAGLAAVIAEQRDTSFHSLDELRAFTALPVLATIPDIWTPADKRRKRLRLGVAALAVLCVVGVLGAGATLYMHGNQSLAQRFSHHSRSSNS